MRGLRTLVYAAVAGGVGYRLLASGQLTADTGIGRTTRPLGPITVAMAAPRETVFDVIAAPYLGRTPRALADEIEVIERGSDMVLAAHRTPVGAGIVTTTIETVRFDRPATIDFRLVRGPVPHVVERFTLHPDQDATRSTTPASSARTSGRSANGGPTRWPPNGKRQSKHPSIASRPKPNDAHADRQPERSPHSASVLREPSYSHPIGHQPGHGRLARPRWVHGVTPTPPPRSRSGAREPELAPARRQRPGIWRVAARHAHPGGRDPGLDHRRRSPPPTSWASPQHPHAAGARARHRPGGRRRHRHARERLPAHGDGQEPHARGLRRRRGDRLRDPRHHHRPRRGVRAGRVPHRPRRPAVQRVRHRGRGLGADLGLRGADAHADALLAHPEASFGTGETAAQRRAVGPGRRQVSIDASSSAWITTYERTAPRSLASPPPRRWSARSASLLAAVVVCSALLPQELVPTEDRGIVFNIVLAPEGSTLEYTDRYMRQAEAIYCRRARGAELFTAVGLGFGGPGRVTDGFMFVRLKPLRRAQAQSQQQIVQSALPAMLSHPRRARVPDQPAEPGRRLRSSPVRVRAPGRHLRRAADGDGRDHAGRRSSSAIWSTWTPISSSTSRSSTSRSTATAPPRSASRSPTSARTLQTLLGGREVTRLQARQPSSTT